MKNLALFAALSLLIAGCGEEIEATSQAADVVKAGQEEAPAADPKTAVFAIPDMSLSVEKELVQMVRPSAINAKPKAEEGLFLVTFNSEKMTAAALLERIHSVSPGATLKKVTAAVIPKAKSGHGTDGHDCGGCPMANSCGQ
jgi:hypothetical protein